MTKPRPDQPGRWRKGSPRIEWDRERADRLQKDVERMQKDIERLTAERDAAIERLERVIDQWRKTGRAVISEMNRADKAEAERDALIAVGKRQAARLARVEALAEEWDGDDSCDNRTCVPHRSASALRAALAGSEADTGAEEAGHRCEPYYSRAECGQCGWQEQWCVTCSRQMCGCATDAMGADQ